MVNPNRPGNGVPKSVFALSPIATPEREVLDQELFHKTISLERKRSERSRKPFLLMLLDTGAELSAPSNHQIRYELISGLIRMTRETDAVGWYQSSSTLGAMFTEIGNEDRNKIMGTMLLRVTSMLHEHLTLEQFSRVGISFHIFPEHWDVEGPDGPSNPVLYPDLPKREEMRKVSRIVKRAMDIAGSLLALIVGSPIFLLLAMVIKLTSKGPVFYRQQRLGQYGVPFFLLKFRSMHENNDNSLHKEYVRQLIAGVAEKKPTNGNGHAVYKLTSDPRITPVGAFLRRSSLDELPQFINVLKGDMSLVGPRPPIGYEVETYELWHRRRLLEAKPGITGLWQVNGRNRLGFDEMVRLDLRYAKTWSPWMDVKILLRTPRAMAEGAH
ncbi:MAG TPA: sugar transferase [Terriglobales bacterium]|nr:sugar transferase [Terriglobales bacterium]